MKVSTSGSKPRAIVLNVRERTRGWLNAVNLHWTGVAVLGLLNLYLLVQMGLAWKLANSQNAEALATQRVQLKTAEMASKPLEGLDVKLASANGQADRFYLERLPVSYSEVAGELGKLKTAARVRLTRVNYTQPALNAGSGADKLTGLVVPHSDKDHLTEVQMDASLTGDYRALVTFINGLERDRVFFLVNTITLTGQSTGVVSLRIRLTTFLRGMVPGDEVERANATAPSSSSEIDADIEKQAGRRGGTR